MSSLSPETTSAAPPATAAARMAASFGSGRPPPRYRNLVEHGGPPVDGGDHLRRLVGIDELPHPRTPQDVGDLLDLRNRRDQFDFVVSHAR